MYSQDYDSFAEKQEIAPVTRYLQSDKVAVLLGRAMKWKSIYQYILAMLWLGMALITLIRHNCYQDLNPTGFHADGMVKVIFFAFWLTSVLTLVKKTRLLSLYMGLLVLGVSTAEILWDNYRLKPRVDRFDTYSDLLLHLTFMLLAVTVIILIHIHRSGVSSANAKALLDKSMRFPTSLAAADRQYN